MRSTLAAGAPERILPSGFGGSGLGQRVKGPSVQGFESLRIQAFTGLEFEDLLALEFKGFKFQGSTVYGFMFEGLGFRVGFRA